MTKTSEFEFVYELPHGEHNPFVISDILRAEEYGEMVIKSKNSHLLVIELTVIEDVTEPNLSSMAETMLEQLPVGTVLREIKNVDRIEKLITRVSKMNEEIKEMRAIIRDINSPQACP